MLLLCKNIVIRESMDGAVAYTIVYFPLHLSENIEIYSTLIYIQFATFNLHLWVDNFYYILWYPHDVVCLADSIIACEARTYYTCCTTTERSSFTTIIMFLWIRNLPLSLLLFKPIKAFQWSLMSEVFRN